MLDNCSDIFDSSISFDPTTHNQQFLINHHENNFNHFPNLDHHLNLHHSQNQHFLNMEQQEEALTMFENNINNNNCLTTTPPPAPDLLLNLFQLPKCSSSISFSNPTQVMYDHPAAALLPPQPPFFKELLNSLPNGFNLTGCGSIFGEMDMETAGHEHYHNQQQGLFHQGGSDHHTVLEFGSGKGIRDNNNNNNKDTKHFATEKHRRLQLNGKFDALKRLVPNPTKPDRASVVGDAIAYINELKRTVEELKILVERKRCSRGRMKKHKTDDDSTLDVESIYSRSYGAGNGNGNGNGNAGDTSHDQQAYNGNSSSTMRTSWLQRKSKNTEIDVRIIDDEVTIKLVQQKRINCLLLVSKVLDELQLDLHHVAGGLIGDFYSYLFNTKICEGSSVYASAIANKLIEVVDKQYATIPVTSSYQVEN